MKKRNCAGPKSARLYLVKRERWRIRGRGLGSPALLILDQNGALRAENKFFWDCPPLSQGLDDRPLPSPPYVKVWIRHWRMI